MTGGGRRWVARPMAATTVMAPSPAQNHCGLSNSTYREVEARAVPAAVASVSR